MPEFFQTFDEHGQPLELVERSLVHATGLWHRSSVVYLFHPDGRLYVQRRAACKDLYENKLDHTVGEHLKPGETYTQGAHRGLDEELGLVNIKLELLGGERRVLSEIPEHGIKDYEFQQTFRGVYEGDMQLDPNEVSEVCLFSLDELALTIAREPESFTQWFADDLIEFGILPIVDKAKAR